MTSDGGNDADFPGISSPTILLGLSEYDHTDEMWEQGPLPWYTAVWLPGPCVLRPQREVGRGLVSPLGITYPPFLAILGDSGLGVFDDCLTATWFPVALHFPVTISPEHAAPIFHTEI